MFVAAVGTEALLVLVDQGTRVTPDHLRRVQPFVFPPVADQMELLVATFGAHKLGCGVECSVVLQFVGRLEHL